MSEVAQSISFIDPQSLHELIRSGEKAVIVDVWSRETGEGHDVELG
ncbi:hypothetical protein [Cupriavidus alkaliphilus]